MLVPAAPLVRALSWEGWRPTWLPRTLGRPTSSLQHSSNNHEYSLEHSYSCFPPTCSSRARAPHSQKTLLNSIEHHLELNTHPTLSNFSPPCASRARAPHSPRPPKDDKRQKTRHSPKLRLLTYAPGPASWNRLVLGWHAPSGRVSALSANRESGPASCSSE